MQLIQANERYKMGNYIYTFGRRRLRTNRKQEKIKYRIKARKLECRNSIKLYV